MTELESPTSTSSEPTPTGWPFSNVSAIAMLLLVAGVYGWVFAAGTGKILSQQNMDLTTVNVPWLNFLFHQFRSGHIPLWNPHYFSGSPFLGDLNSAVLYPVNWLVAVLPLDLFINLSIVLHLFLAGLFTSLWCRQRGISPIGSILGGAVAMLGGVSIMHIDAGHVQIIAACAWMPLIFLSIDKLFDDGRFRWALLGALAVGLSIVSGFAQLVYYVGLMAGLYTLLRIAPIAWAALSSADAPQTKAGGGPWIRIFRAGIFGLVIYAGGAALGAAELAPALDTAHQSVRSSGLSYEMASSCPQPSEMFLSLIDSRFWGDYTSDGKSPNPPTFFARWYPWEVTSFIGVGCFVLAGYGAFFGKSQSRRFMLLLSFLCVILALGKTTPLYRILYDHLPLYNSFRSTNRWNIPMTLFTAVLAGSGLDALLRNGRRRYWFAGLVLVSAAILFLAYFGIRNELALPNAGYWGRLVHHLADSKDLAGGNEVLFTSHDVLTSDSFIHDAGMFASRTLLLPAGCMAGAALLIIFSWYWKPAAYGLLLMVLAELCTYTACNRYVTDMIAPNALSTSWKDAIGNLGPDGRVLSSALNTANMGMVYGYDDAYGYDPVVLKRYAEFLAAIQTDVAPELKQQIHDGLNWIPQVSIKTFANKAEPNKIGFIVSGRLWLLRVKYVFAEARLPQPVQLSIMPGGADVPTMPRAKLVSQYGVKSDRDAIFDELTSGSFDALNKVIIEQKPNIEPDPGATGGHVTLKDLDTDHIEINADLTAPQILLISDSYASGWRVRNLDPLPPQDHYDVLPADYTLRAIPLREGHHHFVLEYAPQSYAVGKIVSLSALLAWAGCLGLVFFKRKKRVVIRRGELPPRDDKPYDGGMAPAVGGEPSLAIAEADLDLAAREQLGEQLGEQWGEQPDEKRGEEPAVASESVVLPETVGPSSDDELFIGGDAPSEADSQRAVFVPIESTAPQVQLAQWQQVDPQETTLIPPRPDFFESEMILPPITASPQRPPVPPAAAAEPEPVEFATSPDHAPVPAAPPPADEQPIDLPSDDFVAPPAMPPVPIQPAPAAPAHTPPSPAPAAPDASPATSPGAAGPTPPAPAPQKPRSQPPAGQKWANIPRFEGFGTRPPPKRKPPAPQSPPPDPKSGGT